MGTMGRSLAVGAESLYCMSSSHRHASEISLPASVPAFSLPSCTSEGTAVSEAVRFRLAATVKQIFKPALLLSTSVLDNPKSCTLCSELEELLLAYESPSQP